MHKLSTVILYRVLRYPQSGRSWLITNSLPILACFPRRETPEPHHQHRLGTQKTCKFLSSILYLLNPHHIGCRLGLRTKALLPPERGGNTWSVPQGRDHFRNISRCHLSHTYPCLVSMSLEKTSLTECLMSHGAHIHVDVTVCGFPFIALARPRNWFWYWVSVFPSSSIFTILWQFLINIWVWIQRFSGSQEMVQVLTRPDFFILQDLGIWKCSRTLVFAITFTEQLSLPTDKH